MSDRIDVGRRLRAVAQAADRIRARSEAPRTRKRLRERSARRSGGSVSRKSGEDDVGDEKEKSPTDGAVTGKKRALATARRRCLRARATRTERGAAAACWALAPRSLAVSCARCG